MIMTSPPSPPPPPPVSSRTNNPNNSSFKNPFSSGLGRVSFVFTAKNDVIGVELRRYRIAPVDTAATATNLHLIAGWWYYLQQSSSPIFYSLIISLNLSSKGGRMAAWAVAIGVVVSFWTMLSTYYCSTCINYQMDLALTLTARVHTRRHGIITTIKKIPQSPFRKQSKNHGMHRRSSSSSSRMPRLLRVRVVNNNNNIPMEIGSK